MKKFDSFSIQTVTALPRFDQNRSVHKFGAVIPNATKASIYINIPYCRSICRFCMLRKAAKLNETVPDEFITILLDEIEKKAFLFQDVVIDSVYFGGGTPSLLNSWQVDRILKLIYKKFATSSVLECVIEGEAKSFLRNNFLEDIYKLGVRKISFGLQTLDPEMRNFLGRTDSVEETIEVANVGNEIGFDEINVDYMYNLPGFSLEKIIKDVENMLSIGYNSIDCHPLKYISCSSKMLNDIYSSGMKLPSAFDRIEQYNTLRDMIMEFGMKEQLIDQYTSLDVDNTNLYIRKLNALDGGQYIGFGPGARSYYGGYGFLNPKSLHDYSSNIEGKLSYENGVLSSDVNNYITRFPKRNQPISKEVLNKSNYSKIYEIKFLKLVDSNYASYDNNLEHFVLTHDGRSWYQNLQEYLLSPGQHDFHTATSRKRDYKFEKFDGYFDTIGSHLNFES